MSIRAFISCCIFLTSNLYHDQIGYEGYPAPWSISALREV
jgi:hypothetical protein